MGNECASENYVLILKYRGRINRWSSDMTDVQKNLSNTINGF